MLDPKRVIRGMLIEHREHPWTTKQQARQIAMDHLNEHPRMYPLRKRS